MVSRALKMGCCLALLTCGLPSLAHANRLKVTSYGLEPNAGVIELSADEPLGEPWMRVSGSSVRVWFPNVERLSRFDQGDLEQPIRSVRLRAGSDKTAVLSLELNPGRSLTESDIELSRSGTRATVRIALLAPPQAMATAAAPGAKPATIAAAVPSEAAVTATHVPAAVPVAAAATPAASAGQASAPEFAATPRALPAALRPKAEPKLIESKPGPSSTELLLFVSLGLAAVYGLLRIVMRKRAAAIPRADIQILASKRLGARHQLMIVRALGQDHLLSVNGGRTERLLSAHAEPLAPAAEPQPEPRRGEHPGSALSATLRSMRSRDLFAAAQSSPNPASKEGAPPNDDTPFGAELIDFVRGQSRRAADPRGADAVALTTHALSESEAVAGLVRLRKRSI